MIYIIKELCVPTNTLSGMFDFTEMIIDLIFIEKLLKFVTIHK